MKTILFISNVQMFFFFFLIFFWIYQITIYIISNFKKENLTESNYYNHHFMAIIPARNEEKVIGNLIKSLKNQGYPEELLDIFVIADNCTDNTAYIAKENGAIVYERFNEIEKSKGYALEWFFNIVLENFPNKYDAFCIFDADNIVASDFIYKMNKKLCNGELIVQGYREIKNPTDNWLTGCYTIFYWTMNKCYHYARYKLGLSPLINGTGFMVSMSIINKLNGWHTETLTEDIEFSLKVISEGYKIGWAKDAIVYDEQPLSFAQSCRQRLRWSVGHIQCFKTCFSSIITGTNNLLILIDNAIYILGMPMIFISLIITFLDILKFLIIPSVYFNSIIGGIKFSTFTFMIIMVQNLFILLTERKNFKKIWKGLATYPIFLLSWFAINVIAFFEQKLEWKIIEHRKAIEIHEIQ